MIERPLAPVGRHEEARLTPVLCAECGHPVSHMDPRVLGALAGGMCTRCRRDRNGIEKRVYTYERRVGDQ